MNAVAVQSFIKVAALDRITPSTATGYTNMTTRVHYLIAKYLLTEATEPERLTRQRAEALEERRE